MTLPNDIAERRVLIVGMGVVGLPLAQLMAQHGLDLVLCDHDYVERANLVKQHYDLAHVGMKKVDAAAELILRHQPKARLGLYDGDARDLGVGALAAFSLIVAAVDNRSAERHLARAANLAGVDYLRLSTRGSERLVEVMVVPAGKLESDACGACVFSPADEELADTGSRIGCAREEPEAGTRTYAEHGLLAAALAFDALHYACAAPRLLRFVGGATPSLSSLPLPDAHQCGLHNLPFHHGPVNWQQLSVDETVQHTLARAAATLSATIEQLLVEFDSGLCLLRACSHGCQPQGPAFYRHRAARCSVCDGELEQRIDVRRVMGAAELCERLGQLSWRGLGSPTGLALRVASANKQLGLYARVLPTSYSSRVPEKSTKNTERKVEDGHAPAA